MQNLYLATLAAALMASASVFAQTTAPAPSPLPSAPPVAVPAMPAPSSATPSMTLTDSEAKAWVDKVVYSSDGKNVGEVAAFVRDTAGKVSEMHIDIGGLMGIGETRVRLMPAQFRLVTDRVAALLSEVEIKALPKIAK
jgi:hypothetical protein